MCSYQLLPPNGLVEIHWPPLYNISPPTEVCIPPRLDRER